MKTSTSTRSDRKITVAYVMACDKKLLPKLLKQLHDRWVEDLELRAPTTPHVMKFFIASHSQETAKMVSDGLVALGHEVTARWITSDTKFSHGLTSYSDEERIHLTLMDEEDVHAAKDGLVLIAEAEGRFVPGGKHVETGMALALGRPVYVIGRRENLFHWHPRVRVFASLEDFFAWLANQSQEYPHE